MADRGPADRKNRTRPRSAKGWAVDGRAVGDGSNNWGSRRIELTLDGQPISVAPGTTVAAAVWNGGEVAFRRSVDGEPRAPLCGMGICFECRLEIDGRLHERSCNLPCRPGMVVRTASLQRSTGGGGKGDD